MQVCIQEKQREESVLEWVDIILHGNRVLRRANSFFTSTWHHLVTYHCSVRAFLVQKGDDWRREKLQKDCCKEEKISLPFIRCRSLKKLWILATPRHEGKALARWDPPECGQWSPRNYFYGRLQSSCHSRSLTAVYAEACQKWCCWTIEIPWTYLLRLPFFCATSSW